MNNQDYLYQLLTRDAGRLGGLQLWLVFRALPALVATALLLLLFWAAPGRAAMADIGHGPDEVAGGELLLQGAADDSWTPALMQSSNAHIEISGMIAVVALEQSFRNDSERAVEGVYAFPLPDTAAVRAMEMTIDERRIVGKIREREEAKQVYAAARAAGRKASLVEQQRPNLFTNRVANIGPGETVTVKLEYVQQVAFRQGGFSLRLPTTITPRYMPGAAPAVGTAGEETAPLAVNPYRGWAGPTDQVPDADAISPLQLPQPGDDYAPLNPLQISVRLDPGMPLARVEAPYHEIALARRAGVYSVSLASGVTEMDRDFVLTWQPVAGAAPRAALFTEEVAGEYYGLLMVLPPASARAAPSPPREVVFVVDTSGSMGGVAIDQAREAVSRALAQLRPEDRFNIIEFNSSYRALYRRPLPATRHHIGQAREFVRQLSASGGTEMLPALRAALELAPEVDELAEQLPLRQVVFITDGAVGNEVALFEEISARLGDTRLFTVGIGSAPNSWFMREAARFGRGSHTHIGSLEEVGEKMGELFARLSQPASVDLDVSWPGAVESWPERLPDLYLGEPLLVVASFGKQPPRGRVVVNGTVAGKPWQQAIDLAPGVDPLTAPRHQGVASLWARQKIGSLLDGLVLGRSEEAVRAEVLPLALRHQLLSPYTSFVAVEEVVSLPEGTDVDTVPVPNTRPRGQAAQSFAYPRTATTGPAKVWFGLLLLFAATLVRVIRQPEVDHAPMSPKR